MLERISNSSSPFSSRAKIALESENESSICFLIGIPLCERRRKIDNSFLKRLDVKFGLLVFDPIRLQSSLDPLLQADMVC